MSAQHPNAPKCMLLPGAASTCGEARLQQAVPCSCAGMLFAAAPADNSLAVLVADVHWCLATPAGVIQARLSLIGLPPHLSLLRLC
jgi:hypothetical protein